MPAPRAGLGRMENQKESTMTDRPPNKRELAKARTYQKVMEAAADLFGKPGGYEAATIRSIAKAAGMSTGALFSCFADKAALYRAVYGHAPITPEQGREMLAVLGGIADDAGWLTVKPHPDRKLHPRVLKNLQDASAIVARIKP